MEKKWKEGESLGRTRMRKMIFAKQGGFPKPSLMKFNIQLLFVLLRLRSFSSFPQR